MRNRDAYVIYLILQGMFSLFFYTIITVNMVYQTELVRRRFNTSNNVVAARLLFALSALQIACVVTFALAGNFVIALVAYWSVGITRVVIDPTYTAWLAQNVDAKVRATIISMSGQIDAIGQIAGGPIIGVIGTVVSIRAAIVAAGSLLAPSLLLFGRAIRQGREKTEIVAK